MGLGFAFQSDNAGELTVTIAENVQAILRELPEQVELVAVAKGRTAAEILEAVQAGARIVGENFVQEAEQAHQIIGDRVQWHFIGHLQSNKVKKAVNIFDMIETVDSVKIAREIDKRCGEMGKVMPVLVEVNIGRERQKSGVLPEQVEPLIGEISIYPNIRVTGLMTIEPEGCSPEDSRQYFAQAKKLYDSIGRLGLHNVVMKYLSMGMSATYRIALEEGANMVRIGTAIFGARR